MSLKGIISISGMPGLFKVLAQTKSGFIVESLTDKRRMPVSSSQKISMLEDISVFTNTDDMPLTEVMLKIKDHAEKNEVADPKADPSKLRDFFNTVIPEFDKERVYPSDIKKIINWFHLVKDFVADPDPEPEEAKSESSEEPVAVEETPAPAKKEKSATAKTASKKKAAADNDSETKEKPAAKTRKKKES